MTFGTEIQAIRTEIDAQGGSNVRRSLLRLVDAFEAMVFALQMSDIPIQKSLESPEKDGGKR